MSKNTTGKAAPEAKAEDTTKAKTAAPKATRKTLSVEERIAKAEAEVQALRAKAQEKDRKRFAEVTDKITALETKRNGIDKQLEELGGERDAIVARVPELVNEQQTAEL